MLFFNATDYHIYNVCKPFLYVLQCFFFPVLCVRVAICGTVFETFTSMLLCALCFVPCTVCFMLCAAHCVLVGVLCVVLCAVCCVPFVVLCFVFCAVPFSPTLLVLTWWVVMHPGVAVYCECAV